MDNTPERLLEQVDALQAEGLWDEASEVLHQCLEEQQLEFGQQSAEAGALHLRLASLHHASGDLQGAEAWLRAGLEILKLSHGERHQEVATAALALGYLLEEAGRPEEAVETEDQALQIYLDLEEPDLAAVASGLVHLGQLLLALGRLDEAESALLRAQEPAEGDWAVMGTLHGVLGQVYQLGGQFGDAEDAMHRSVEYFEALGEASAEFPVALANLGHLCRQQGHLEAAEDHLSRALEAWRGIPEEEGSSVASALADLGIVARARGKLEAARDHFETCLELRRAFFPPAPEEVATALNNLALTEKDLGRHDAAEALYSESIEMLYQLHGPEHPSVAVGLSNLAEVHRGRGRFDEAEPLLAEALRLLKASRPEDPRTASVRRKLGQVRRQLEESL